MKRPEGYLGFICLSEVIDGNGTYRIRSGELVIIDGFPERPLMDDPEPDRECSRCKGRTCSQ